MLTIILLLVILINFYLLTKGFFSIPVGMMFAAGASLLLTGLEAPILIKEAFADFSQVAILFTAVAVPAHILQNSSVLDYLGMYIGERIGKLSSWGISPSLLVISISMIITYVMAALFHNTTSILVSSAVILVLCRSYGIPALPVLGGALVASNLGGFSTRWGDTPNIIEAHTWGLDYSIFTRQIMPVNMGLIIILIGFVYLMVRRFALPKINGHQLIHSMIQFRARKRDLTVNKRLLTGGLLGLLIAIVAPLFFHEWEIPLSIIAIIVAIVFEKRENYFNALYVLGIETYATLLAIFMIAKVMAGSSIGIQNILKDLLIQHHAAVWLIIIISYFGTLFTEAASWASAAAPIVHGISSSPKTAWALGAGICAGSSSLITAATAGIILLNETKGNEKEEKMTFKQYLFTGLVFSSLMIGYYILVITYFL